MSREKPSNLLVGALAMVAAAGCFAVMGAASRPLLRAGYDSTQIVLVRSLVGLALAALWAARAGGPRLFASASPARQALGGALGAASLLCALVAYDRMPIAEATAIFAAAPIATAALAPLLLREPTGPRRLAAALIGFSGVLAIVRPGAGLAPAAAFALATMLLTALWGLLQRRLAERDGAATAFLYGQLAFLAVCLPPQIGLWRPVTFEAAGYLAITSTTGALGLVLAIVAHRVCAPAVVGPFGYSSVVWALGLGWAFWGERPDAVAALGIALVLGSGLYLAWRERAADRADPAQRAAST